MIYRRKMYKVAPSIIEEFNRHFNQTLLPTQLKYGARLVGRWVTTHEGDAAEIFAIWEYDSHEEYERIEEKVRSDESHMKRVQDWFAKMGGRDNLKEVFFKIDQDFLESTVVNEKAKLSTKD
ncbi:NIPSNAP family protein [Mangrovibacillus sp. Mu-81]|jgi:hypothetical protein|uniref:NIPSNAP family protein n=1 Tax=Mangrovibacillus sp. Mu-81 TaxID=3121478 RepID=UPI002FE45E05